MESPAHAFTQFFYDRYPGRIALSVGFSPGLLDIFPFVFEKTCGTPIGIIALAVLTMDDREVVHLYHIGAFQPGKGQGTEMLKALCHKADDWAVPMSLSPIPCPNGNPLLLQGEHLAQWYQRFGFKGEGHLIREATLCGKKGPNQYPS